MIKLHGSVPMFGLSTASPFVVKAQILFKMANVPYEGVAGLPMESPKGKIPFITLDDGSKIADSYFIKKYLECLGANFNANYSKKEIAIAHALESMCEDNLYYHLVYYRWFDDNNFNKGPRTFFNNIPEIMREKIIEETRGNAIKRLHDYGISRHNAEEVFEIGKNSIDVIEAILGKNDFTLGKEPVGEDATIFAILSGLASDFFQSSLGEYIRSRPNLMAYIKRMNEKYFPKMPLSFI